MVVAFMLEKRASAKITEDTLFEHPLGKKMKKEHKGAFIVTPSPWIHTENIDTFPSHMIVSADDLINKNNIHKTGGCNSALRDIAVQPEGDVYACCGTTMRKMPDWRLGHVGDIDFGEAYADSASDLLKILIATSGPAWVLDWVARKNPSIEWENRYSHPCEICYHIYHDKHIANTIGKYKTELANLSMLKLLELDLLGRGDQNAAEVG